MDRSAPVAVVGAGTMGGGIAQVAAVAGHSVAVYDAVEGAAERAVAAIRDRVVQLVARGRPLAWGQSWGPATVLGILEAMHAWYGEDRYRPSALLRRIAAAGGDLREK